MEYRSQSLERRLEKPNWKQWIPIYGLYEIMRAQYITNAPAVTDDDLENPLSLTWQGSLVLHTAGLIGATYGLVKLVEKLS